MRLYCRPGRGKACASAVAIPIGHHQLYVSWLDPTSFALVDVFVMDFARHTVYDYAPGSDHPESAGTVTVVHRGRSPLP
jgi:hypothetical protein